MSARHETGALFHIAGKTVLRDGRLCYTEKMMEIPSWLKETFFSLSDGIAGCVPQSLPDVAKLSKVRIVAHRGCHLENAMQENTLESFRKAIKIGVWGVEFDVRWTKDNVPVVFHDPDLRRVYGSRIKLAGTSFQKLRREFPQIPKVEEVLELSRKKVRLFIEVKGDDAWDHTKIAIFQELFEGVVPGVDYYLISRNIPLLRDIRFVPDSATFLVGEWNLKRLSSYALRKGLAGVIGHFTFLTNNMIKAHHDKDQRVGVAFPASLNSLCREVNRGVDLILTNHAETLQGKIEAVQKEIYNQSCLSTSGSTLRQRFHKDMG